MYALYDVSCKITPSNEDYIMLLDSVHVWATKNVIMI
jgi:hypothetical protein